MTQSTSDFTPEATYDVIVVGGGGSGLAAALSAAEHGASVLVLEKEPELGGSTGMAVGSLTAAETRFQQKAGVTDTVASHVEDAGKFAKPEIEARNNNPLRAYLLQHAAETLHWLTDMGLVFHGPSPEPPNSEPRMHNVVPCAMSYILIMQAECQKRGVRILLRARVQELVQQDGRVTGVVADVSGKQQKFAARKGVVLAAGDYSSAPDLITQYKGKEYANVDAINKRAFGDGHKLGQSAGAALVNMDITYGPELRFIPPKSKSLLRRLPARGLVHSLMGKLMPFAPKFIMDRIVKQELVTWQHPEDALFDSGAIFLNQDGERFCNEKEYPQREIAITSQRDKICYILLDKRLAEHFSHWPNFISTAPEIAYAYVDDYLRIRKDVATQGRTLQEVARARGLSPEKLQQTVSAFNAYAQGNATDPFGRDGDTQPFEEGRWVLLGPAKTYFTITEGGIVVDEHLQAHDGDGNPIPGLYAAGMNGSGGLILWGHGLHIAWAITSGRLVGKHLAALSEELPRPKSSVEQERKTVAA